MLAANLYLYHPSPKINLSQNNIQVLVFSVLACTPQVTVSELFKRDVIIASLHLTRCPTSCCQPLQKRQDNKTLIPARFSFCCVLKVSLLHYINFRFCLCIFISGHLLLLHVHSLGQTHHSSCSRRARFFTKVVYGANSETREFDWDVNQI